MDGRSFFFSQRIAFRYSRITQDNRPFGRNSCRGSLRNSTLETHCCSAGIA
jgi:hypothetical protein